MLLGSRQLPFSSTTSKDLLQVIIFKCMYLHDFLYSFLLNTHSLMSEPPTMSKYLDLLFKSSGKKVVLPGGIRGCEDPLSY